MLIKKSITFGVFLLFNTIYLDIFSSYAILILLLLGRVSVEGDWERHDLLLSHTCSLCQRVGQALFKSNDHIRGGSDKNEKEKVDICQQNKHY